MLKIKIKKIINYIFLIYVYMGLLAPFFISMDYLLRYNFSLFTRIFFISALLVAASVINHFVFKYRDKIEIF